MKNTLHGKEALEPGVVGDKDVISDNPFFIGILVRNDGSNYLLISSTVLICLFSPHHFSDTIDFNQITK